MCGESRVRGRPAHRLGPLTYHERRGAFAQVSVFASKPESSGGGLADTLLPRFEELALRTRPTIKSADVDPPSGHSGLAHLVDVSFGL